MAELSARFKLIDEMSDKLSQMATAGQQTTESWESAGEAHLNPSLILSAISAINSLFVGLPNILIAAGWVISIFILIPLCGINVDNVGFNGFQAGFMLDLIAGAIFITLTFRCKSSLPKIIVEVGLILSIIVMICLCATKNEELATAYGLMLMVDGICSVVIFVRMFRKKSDHQS